MKNSKLGQKFFGILFQQLWKGDSLSLIRPFNHLSKFEPSSGHDFDFTVTSFSSHENYVLGISCYFHVMPGRQNGHFRKKIFRKKNVFFSRGCPFLFKKSFVVYSVFILLKILSSLLCRHSVWGGFIRRGIHGGTPFDLENERWSTQRYEPRKSCRDEFDRSA